LHLDSGLMGPGQGETDDSSDSSSSPPAPTPPAPAPPAPVYVPPPAPPPSPLDESRDPFSSGSNSAWTADSTPTVEALPPKVSPVASETPASSFDYEKMWTADSTPKVEASPPKPSPVTSETAAPSSDYEKMLFGTSDSATTPSHSWSFDRAQKPVDEPKSQTSMWAPTSSSNPFDDAQKLIDAAPAVQAKPEAPTSSAVHVDDWMSAFGEPASATLVKTPEVAPEKVLAPDTAPTLSYKSPFDKAQELIDSQSAQATPESTAFHLDAPAKPVDSGSSWTSAFDEPASPIAKYLDAGAASVVATPAEVKPKEEDSITRMRRLFKENSLLQKSKKGHKQMVSIKLYRSK